MDKITLTFPPTPPPSPKLHTIDVPATPCPSPVPFTCVGVRITNASIWIEE